MADYARKALARYPFDKIWVPDHLTYENVFVVLAAIISGTTAHVGTSVVHPFSRTPVDLASSFAALAHLAERKSTGLTVGIGAGSASSNMIRKRKRVAMVRQTVLFLRRMFTGERVKLGDFPELVDFFRLDGSAEARLHLPPENPPEIYIAAAGPRMLELAWELGDGVILSNLSFPTSLVRLGALDLAMAPLNAHRARCGARSFTKVLHLHVSVSRDREAARRCAKTMAGGALIQGHLLKQRMLKLPFPDRTAHKILAAHAQGSSPGELIDMLDDDLIASTGAVIAGTPDECIAGIDEMLQAVKPHRFDIVDIASPLGPDWDESIDLICREVIPEVARRSSYSNAG